MATASKTTVVVAEYHLTLTNTEAHELLFYLAQRGSSFAFPRSTAVVATNGIHDALRKAMN